MFQIKRQTSVWLHPEVTAYADAWSARRGVSRSKLIAALVRRQAVEGDLDSMIEDYLDEPDR